MGEGRRGEGGMRRIEDRPVAVPHQGFRQKELEAYFGILRQDGARVLVDVKGVLPRDTIEDAGVLFREADRTYGV